MDNNINSLRAKKLSISGILLSLTVITLFFATVLPVNKLSLFALSSFFVSVIVIEFGAAAGWVFYISSCLLALFVVQNKIELVHYLLFFGIYGILKFYIEKLNKIVLEYILKIILFNIYVTVSIFVIKQFFLEDIKIDFPWWVIIAGFEIVFLVYDYVYTLFIQYYREKLKKAAGL